MSRRKHSWAAYLDGQTDSRGVEAAVVEDFVDDLMEEMDALDGILTGDAKMGCQLAIRELHRVADQWTERTI